MTLSTISISNSSLTEHALRNTPIVQTSNRLNFIRKTKKEIPFFTFEFSNFLELFKILESEIKEISNSRHSAFATTDFEFKNDSKIYKMCYDSVLKILEDKWGFEEGDLDLLDLFLVVYTHDGQRNLAPHTDGCLISFNIQMNDPSVDFEGGGTLFVDSNNLVKLAQGQGVAHDAKLLHAGQEITSGTRKILVGFVETKKEAVIKRKLIKMSRERNAL